MSITKRFLIIFALIRLDTCLSQDTSFVRSLPLDSTVQNITTNGQDLYIRFNKSICIWSQGELEFLTAGKLKYSKANYDSGSKTIFFNHSLFLENETPDKIRSWNAILPGKANNNTTDARIGNQLFIAHNGVVLEYKITPYVRKYHPGISIRHIFSIPEFRFISSYSGLFVDTIFDIFSKTPIPDRLANYSNGEFVEIDSLYLLCQDNLLIYDKNKQSLETLIQTEEKARFRKMIKFNDSVYGLYNKAFGEVDLNQRKILPYIITDDLSDCIVHDNKLFISSTQNTLYELNDEGTIRTFSLPYSINDLSIINGTLHVGTTRGLYSFSNEAFDPVIESFEIIQAMQSNGKLIVTNNQGLYLYHDKRIIPVLEGVEFNKMALKSDEHYVYAGSVDGLYVIKPKDINELSTFTVTIEEENKTMIYIAILGALLSIISFLLFGYHFKRKQKSELTTHSIKPIFNSEKIRTVMRENPNIISAEMLADHLNTSVVQINRHLKNEKTTSLKVMKSIKREIALEMYDSGKKVEDIAKRIGYSPRYIKENFLKKTDINT